MIYDKNTEAWTIFNEQWQTFYLNKSMQFDRKHLVMQNEVVS